MYTNMNICNNAKASKKSRNVYILVTVICIIVTVICSSNTHTYDSNTHTLTSKRVERKRERERERERESYCERNQDETRKRE